MKPNAPEATRGPRAAQDEYDWKRKHIRALKESIAFFDNANKLERERWVVARLLKALRIEFVDEELTGAEEPTDVAFRAANFQVKEILNDGRRRADEFKNALESAQSANSPGELLQEYRPTDISFAEIVNRCYDFAQKLVDDGKYGPLERNNIDLICYFNWLDCQEVPPLDFPSAETGFRSLSVVSNRYCAIAHAGQNAPVWIRDNKGLVADYYET